MGEDIINHRLTQVLGKRIHALKGFTQPRLKSPSLTAQVKVNQQTNIDEVSAKSRHVAPPVKDEFILGLPASIKKMT